MTLQEVQALTDEEIRVRVAELNGWSQIRIDYRLACGLTHSAGNGLIGISPINNSQGLTNPETCSWIVPNYPADLNACHEVVISQDPETIAEFCNRLADVCHADPRSHPHSAIMQSVNATARQRCKALLLTLTQP